MQEPEHKFSETIQEYTAKTGALILKNTPGMRMIKTTLAVILCLIVDWLRVADSPYNAAIAAIVCMQQDLASSWKISRNRVVGTLIAGVYAYLFLLVFSVKLGLSDSSLLYYVLVGVFMLPLMQLLVSFKYAGGVAIGSIVFLLICLTSGKADPLAYSFSRTLDTLIGIALAMVVNWLPFLNQWGEKLQQRKLEAQALAKAANSTPDDAATADDNDTTQNK